MVTLPAAALDRKRQIVGLDLIRALAAFLVVQFHLGFWAWQDPGLRHVPAIRGMWTTPLFSAGWVGVEIFFVLSGFVIAYSTERTTPGRFFVHRFQRLFPAALICATITGVFRTAVAYPWQQTLGEWMRSVSFFPIGPWVDGTYWTLPVEIAFYLLVFVMLFWGRARFLPFAMAGVGLVSTGVCLLLWTSPNWAPVWLLTFLASCWFPPHACLLLMYGCFFALGVFLYLGLIQGLTRLRALIITLLVIGCVVEILWREGGMVFPMRRHEPNLYPPVLWAAALLFIVAAVMWNAAVQRLVGTKGMAFTRKIGLTTYPLYLLHANIGEALMHGLFARIGYVGSLFVVGCIVSASAALIALVLEPWLRRGLGRFGAAIRGIAAPGRLRRV